ncbi:hypothetical protein [Streptomyces chryseus]|uniref:Uncharacterized protein n=1 Tax=Streptomyces chryseus TaxID=68186 RepID=A0ABQ3DK33_9ACTN|nr:hypothetical protein [Streptomyces chryseus]GGX37830.1 hypothetical protein GCM10010353_61630 [Streptomyces chryseus]GHA94828.1 hypothetical protein GCM10010346_17070 [Streptomyces chryseus]
MTTEQQSRSDARQAIVALVEKDLEALGLTPTHTTRGGVSYRTLPVGKGWCQVLYAPEEAWPPGADLCVIVRWHPDKAYRRNNDTGHVPAGAEEHWRERTRATIAALATAGYKAAATGPPRAPRLHAQEDILVWRVPEDHEGAWPPFQAWHGSAPARPNLDQPDYRYPERNPLHLVEAVLNNSRRHWPAADLGRVLTVTASAVIWPPHAESCVRVLWQPSERFQRLPDGAVPAGAEEHWRAGVSRVRQDLVAAGYHVRGAERPMSPARDEDAGLLVWRGAYPHLG